ncbi:MAG: DUF4097 domain-containing protein [Bryobacterales bacterium]|nr:DUF4097 domain-containing protein [Bryobacterales bacterium]
MTSSRRWAILTAAALIFLAGSPVVAAIGDFGKVTEDFTYSYPLAAGGTLEIFSRNGSVEVLGWEKETVEIRGTKYAQNRDELDRTKVDISVSPVSLVIRSVFPDNRASGKGVRYVIRAPFAAVVNMVETSNGGVRVEQVARVTKLATSNGSMVVYRSAGPLAANTSNGSIRVTETKGDLRLSTSNGRIEAESVVGSIHANTSNSSIRVAVQEPAAGEALQLETSNGTVELTMRSYAANPMTLETSNGGIVLRLPRGANATIAARTRNGAIQSAFRAPDSRTVTKDTLDTTLGTGGPLIKLTTSNGSIRLLAN